MICKEKVKTVTTSFIVLYLFSDLSYGQTSKTDDYSYIEASKGFYKIHTTHKTWSEGKQVCATEGATLWYPENDDEARAVKSFWNANQPGVEGVFVGLTDVVTEGVFKTIDGKSFSEVYNKWDPGQPDDRDGTQDCMYLYKEGHLGDWGCENTYPFICKKSLPSDGQTSKKDDYSYIEASKSFYKIHTTHKTWSEGKQVCATEGATLWYPENDDEARAVKSFWNANQPGVEGVFVGLTDVVTEGVFKTIDGKSFSEVYNKCDPGQPDDRDGTQDCMYLYKEGSLGDWGCENTYPFICKKSLPSDGQTSKKDDYSYIEASKSFYKIHTTHKTWSEGKQVCATEGATLWYPENDDEARAVKSFWNANQPGVEGVFVGLTDVVTEGVFKTIDGKSFSEVYNKWDPGQPDDRDGTQDCMYLYKEGSLGDWGCENTYPFICKKSLQSDGQTSKKDDYSYIEASKSFYKIHTTHKTWSEGKQVCATEGATLWYPENDDEARAVKSFWNANQPGVEGVFVGLTDVVTEGVFKTIDGKSFSEVYNKWDPGQPDDRDGTQDCMYLYKEGSLGDWGCENTYPFICKKSLQSDGQTSKKDDYSYIEASKSFYKIHTTHKTWSEGKQVCATEGATLWYPENDDEARAVKSFWNANQPGVEGVFVGLTDVVTEGVFKSIDGKSFSEVYNKWDPDQPDDRDGTQDCMYLYKEGSLGDWGCENTYPFICKKSLPSDGQKNQTSFQTDYNYIEALGSYYKFHTTKENWRDAKRVCAEEKASLFYPGNSDEANAVISFWKLYQNNTEPDSTWMYVGISDIITEGEFETIDGKSISEVYNKWKLHQPDNNGDEDCIHLNQLGCYNDVACGTAYNFICKKSLLTLDQNYSCPIQQHSSHGQTPHKLFRKDYTYIEASQGFYKIHTIPATFTDAKRVCALEGASLFYPENSNEANAVISSWNRTQPTIPKVYVGISTLIAKGVFETIDNKPISEVYNNWEAGQPNNYVVIGGDCVLLKKEGTYYDGTCDKKYPYICKRSLQTLKWDNNCNMSHLDYTFNKDIGKCYKFHTSPLNWAEAYAVCSAEQSYLAVITSGSEAEYLAKLTESAPEQKAKGNYLRGIYHLGFHNKFNEGWQTVKGTLLHDAEAWWGNYQPEADDREQCGAMFFNGLLTHINCDIRSFFICEHEGVNETSGDEENYM